MLKDKGIAGFFLIIFLAGPVFAQTNSNSPYSRFGLGQLSHSGSDWSRAMGGIGMGLRNNHLVNPLNPASFTAIDTLSFLFDFGISGSNSVFEADTLMTSYFASNLDHIALGFPLARWWTISAGVMPYSKVGYSIKEETFEPGIGFIDFIHSGSGGINQIYMATSVEFFNVLSVGTSFKYLFGRIDLKRKVLFPLESTNSIPEITRSTLINDFIIGFGIQYNQAIGEDLEFILGGIYDLGTGLSAERRELVRNIFPGNEVVLDSTTTLNPDFILSDTSFTGKMDIPERIGAGFTLNYRNRLMLGVDYYMQDWTDVVFFGEEQSLARSSSIHGGLQLTPNPEALRGYHNLVSYRVGGHYTNGYLKLKDEQLKYYGISFGAGLPLRNSRSSFDFAVKLGGTLKNNLLQEKYMFLSFSLTLRDLWFFKTRFD